MKANPIEHNRQAMAAAVAELMEADRQRAKNGRSHGRLAVEVFYSDGLITGHELLERTTRKHAVA